jgi:hypothetical protein
MISPGLRRLHWGLDVSRDDLRLDAMEDDGQSPHPEWGLGVEPVGEEASDEQADHRQLNCDASVVPESVRLGPSSDLRKQPERRKVVPQKEDETRITPFGGHEDDSVVGISLFP